ncbi:MAG: YwaF family protein [Acholeplasmatales bacterium]|jgi:hypothetical protein|nr:YwaF family protein [Acholeplasmatales bacterium]
MEKYLWLDGYSNYLKEYKFNINHIYILLANIAVFLILFFVFARKTSNIKIKNIIFAVILVVLEVFRIIFDTSKELYVYNTPFKELNFLKIISFELCAINVWVSVITLFLVSLKKESKIGEFLKNYLFGIAISAAFLTFISPDNIDGHFPLFHVINLQTLITHMLLFFIPIYFIKTKQFEPHMKYSINALMVSVLTASIAMIGSQLAGYSFAYMTRLQIAEDLNIFIPYPFHFIPLIFALYGLTFLNYYIFSLIFKIKPEETIKTYENRIVFWFKVSSIFTGMILLSVVPLFFAKNPVGNLLGLFCFISFIYIGAMIILINKVENINNLTQFENLEVKQKRVFKITAILSFFTGIYLLINYKLQKDSNTKKQSLEN